jgi:SAM-dependent methyltransferase
MPPIPPTDLLSRVVPPFTAAQADAAREGFDRSGADSVERLVRALAAVGRSFGDFERALDFGCGPSRLLRHMGDLATSVELHGVDVDADVIAWSSENVPFATFAVGPHEPPLPYPDGHFDLVFNHSVFTHIDAQRQDLWLGELQRVLRPGGIALLTVHSTRQFDDLVRQLEGGGESGAPYREALERDGILFITDDLFIGTTHPDWYHSTFHAPWYVYEHWRRFLDVRAHLHEGAITQDMVVLERRPAGQEPLPPIGRGGCSAQDSTAPAAAAAMPSGAASSAVSGGLELPPRARVAVGKAKRRALRDEHAQIARHERELAALRAELAELRAAGAGGGEARSLVMMRAALYAQGERISIVERELREQLDTLRDGQARSST